MRASWAKARLWALITAGGGDMLGTATSRPYENAAGKRLVVNAATVRQGLLKAGIMHAANNTFVPGFALSDCIAFAGDDTAAELTWAGGSTVPQNVGDIKVSFHLLRARLYSLTWK